MAKRKKLKKGVKTITTLIILIVLVFGSYFVLTKTSLGNKILSKVDKTIKTESPLEKPEEKEVYPKVYKASLIATGDGLLHNAVYFDAYDEKTKTFDFSPQLEYVKDIIKDYDIVYYNQETTFGSPDNPAVLSVFPGTNYNLPGYSSYPLFNSPSAFGDDMVKAGFNMVSLASNHSADCLGSTDICVTDSYNFWQNKGIVFAGFKPKDNEDAPRYIIAEAGGITYTLLNYTTSLNGLDGYNSSHLINVFNEEQVKKDIAEVRDKVDVVIVAMHWHTGAEYSFAVTEENREIATFLANNGVDIVLGTYSHGLQPFEWIDDTLVYYSLGNFISNQGDIIGDPNSLADYVGIVGVLASLDITKTVQEDGSQDIKIDNLGAELIYTYNKNHHNYKVVPFSKMNADYNPHYLELYDFYKDVFTSLDQNIKVVPVNS